MFLSFFIGIQQDLKLVLVAPVVCALFRLAFILVYRPGRSPRGEWRKWWACFRYAFWWGLDFNAYVFLYSLVLVSLPGAFLPEYFSAGDMVRTAGLTVYLVVLYTAFMGKMIFYYHFHDTFNQTMRLAGHADKKNFIDIFFNQNHGAWILLGYIPYALLCYHGIQYLLATPVLSYVELSSPWLQYGLNTVVFLASVLWFYWLRYGGTLDHRKKPEWDELPAIVKEDTLLSKAAMDDLIALELVLRAPLEEMLLHDDAESEHVIQPVLPAGAALTDDPLRLFRHEAGGPRIHAPKHIFFLLGEGHAQAPFDPIYDELNLMEASQRFRQDQHTVAINNFLPAGMRSRPSVVGLAAGVYDADLELNEKMPFWQGCALTSWPEQLRRLGYRTEFWYGGGLGHGSLEHFLPAAGFDACHSGFDICPADAPRTWLGIYDHVFLNRAAELIREQDADQPVFHFLYTTSNHGPYHMPMDKLGFDMDRVMPAWSGQLKHDKMAWRKLGGCWYADQSLMHFVEEMRAAYPDSLFIVTGDHSTGLIPFEHGVIDRREPSLRDGLLTSFAMHHPELTPEILAGNTIGGHMNILPTLMELIAPKGFMYYSLFPSLTEKLDHVVTPYCWMTEDMLGDYRNQTAQSLQVSAKELPLLRDTVQFKAERDAWCEITGWLVRHPELLNDAGIGPRV